MFYVQFSVVIIVYLTVVTKIRGDLPTNCSYEDTVGLWELHTGQSGYTNQIDCSQDFAVKNILQLQLIFPDQVVDQYGNIGKWSMIYNQGFEIILTGRRYFAFQYYKKKTGATVSYCHKTFNGWSHNIVENNVYPPRNWSCYYAMKVNAPVSKVEVVEKDDLHLQRQYIVDEQFVKSINWVQSSWKAGVYDDYHNFTLLDMIQFSGSNRNLPRVKPRMVSAKIMEEASELPSSIDWRNINGEDYVSPVRNQGRCGSCYAFASMALLETRARIETKNRWKPVFSTQDIVSCSSYSQGCDGGFPYLVAGMYGQDFGVIEEDSYPYTGNDTKCNEPSHPSRTYIVDYGYIGGFYGGCNEALMRIELVKWGPIAVSIMVYPDLKFYKGGIYQHTELKEKFNPFEITNHVVLVVGYGEEAGVKYWIVKNSWGTSWGEDGFFRIVRGADEIAIESIAVFANPYISPEFKV